MEGQNQPGAVTVDFSKFTNPDNIAKAAEATGQVAGTIVQGAARAGVALVTGFFAGAFGNGRRPANRE